MLTAFLMHGEPRAHRRRARVAAMLAMCSTLAGCAEMKGGGESSYESETREAVKPESDEPDIASDAGRSRAPAPARSARASEAAEVAKIRFGPAPEGTKAHDPLAGFPTGERQRQTLCARGARNPVTAVFCAEKPPEIRSLVDLQRALNLDFRADDGSGRTNPQFAITGHSTSLVTRYTSSINPRAILFRQGFGFTAMGFVRGEQFAELVTRDRSGALAFYLVHFRQECNEREDGCGPGDLYTPEVEKNWTSISIYGAEDLRNNVMDCTQCHQSEGPGTRAILRMQELQPPWTHWFRATTPGGVALLQDYNAAKGGEGYAGIPGEMLSRSEPLSLQLLVTLQGFAGAQINEFRTAQIEVEVATSALGQPFLNRVPGKSPTWEALYAKNVAGQTIPVPYHDVKVTDPAKLARVSRAYQSYRAGTAKADQVPDLRDVFPDDRARLAEIGFAPKPGLDGPGLLRQVCSQCHNGKLDQTIPRALFDADLSEMSRAEKDLAIQRVLLPPDDLRVMPPQRFRTLSEAERSTLVEYLRQ